MQRQEAKTPRAWAGPLGISLLGIFLLGCPPPKPTGPTTQATTPPEEIPSSPASPPPLALRAAGASSGEESPLLVALSAELDRAKEGFATQNPAPYFIGYEVIERESVNLSAILGVMENIEEDKARYLQVDLRVGDFSLDNTHPVRSNNPMERLLGRLPQVVSLPIEDDPDALRAALWYATEKSYRSAARRYEIVQANKAVRTEEEDSSDDFSRESPVVYLEAPQKLSLDKKAWEEKLRRYSKAFIGHDDILNSHVTLNVDVVNKYLVTTEGTKLQFSRTYVRLSISGSARADDGMDVRLFESFDAESVDRLPSEEVITQAVDRLINNLEKLREAPLAEPYTGPAILTGRATGVFFHEIFGHRMEGHRQKDEEEGQTFTKKLGEQVMPSFISVYDDPTAAALDKIDLNGHYLYDDQGVPGQRANLVQDGVLTGFLLSRSPIAGFPKSNGHGRRQEGYQVYARQGNLIVETSRAVPEEDLRKLLIEEAKRQGKSYGLLFTDIQGGFTNTSRFGSQAFNVLPVLVYRVYVDGRPDELIRGVDIVGTPLTALGEIVAAGDSYEVFNGYCGAESGFVPVSAVGPALLLRKLETEKQAKGSERPPILPAPPRQGGAK